MTPFAHDGFSLSRTRRGARRAARHAVLIRTLSVTLGAFVLIAAILSIDASGFAATNYIFNNNSTTGGTWNTPSNWNIVVGATTTANTTTDYPGSQAGDTATVNDGGNAQVNIALPNPLAGLTLDTNSIISLNTTSAGDAVVVGTGSFTFTSGTVNGGGSMGIAAPALLNFSNSSNTFLGATINNSGTINYGPVPNASLQIATSGAINNSGTFTLTNDASITSAPQAGPGVIHNLPGGTLRKTAGALPGPQTISPTLINDGLVDVQAGRLGINANGSVGHSGQFTIGSTATLEFQTGSHILTNVAFPSSTPSITGGEVQVDGPVNNPSFLSIGGSGDSGGAVYDVSRTTLPGGALDPNNPNIPAKTDFLDMNSLGTINGAGDFLMRQSGSVTGGQILGSITNHFTVAPAATMVVNPTTSSVLIANVTFVNQGRVNYVTGTSPFTLNASNTFIHNDAGATWDLQGDNAPPILLQGLGDLRTKPDANTSLRTQPAGGPLPPSEFFNDGLLEKTGGTGATDIQIHVTNTGAIDALSGTIIFDLGMTQTAGTTLLANGAPTVPAIASPTASVPPVSILLNGGTLTGGGTLGGDLNNNGANILPGSPTAIDAIAITGNYTQASAGALTLKLGSTSNDHLDTTGTDTLAGTLNLQSFGGFIAQNNNFFTILNYASETGTFTTVNSIGLNAAFTVNYFPTFATVVANVPLIFVNNVSANEGNTGTTPFTFTVTLSAPSNLPVTVNFATSAGTATDGIDFTDVNGTLTFAPGVTSQTITVPVIGDTVIEPDETFFVNLSAPTNASIEVGRGTGTIINDDGACTGGPTNLFPIDNAQQVPTDGLLQWAASASATSYNVFLGSVNGCSTLIGVTTSTSFPYSGLAPNATYQWRVEATSPGCPVASSICQTFTTGAGCPTQKPVIISPPNGSANVSSPITFSWTPVSGAVAYQVFVSVNGGPGTMVGSTTDATTLTASVPNGTIDWSVQALFDGGCPPTVSTTMTFTACNVPEKPVITANGEATTGQRYFISWTPSILGADQFELQESPTPDFTGSLVQTFELPGATLTSPAFQHDAVTATPFYYRVRGRSSCGASGVPTGTPGAFSDVARVVIIPLPAPGELNPDITAPVGSTQPIVQRLFIPGFPQQSWNFTASTDEPWLSVDPTSGILPPGGITLTVTADPTSLPNGTQTGTVIVTLISLTSGKSTMANDTTPPPPINTPVSINVVTPITPSGKTQPSPNTLIIPAAGHVSGANSKWQSDIRLTNAGVVTQKYQLTFTPSGTDATLSSKATTITADGGATIALDDIVKRWYGLGSLSDGVNGTLEIRPVIVGNSIGGRPGTVADDVSVSTVTLASSRTYNTTPSGTLGQFVPALPFSSFVGFGGGNTPSAILSLQQIAQSAAYRTNFGIVEGSGQPVSVLAGIFDNQGVRLASVPINLKAGEHQQIDNFLGKANITNLVDGRIGVSVVSGAGKVMTYASVVDNKTNDPLLITGQTVGQNLARNFVVPGVADLNTGFASWRTDMRIFNSGAPTEATLTFYPQDSPGAPSTKNVTVNTGEVLSLDNLLQSEFGLTNAGGALHVTTVVDSPLIVSARTYNQTSNGTFGQFVPAVTVADAVGNGDRSLNILQVEDSDRFRTNLGLTEVTGQPATVEVSVVFSDTKVTPKVQFQLPANGFVQTRILNMLGISHTQNYNARLVVRVIGGAGKVAAYGSVIDSKTEDPTYVPAQ